MWYYLFIENSSSDSLVSDIKTAVCDLLIASTNKNVAVYFRDDSHKNGTHLYFTPATQSIALAYGASLIEKPIRNDLGSLLSGDQSVIDRLF